MILEKRVATLLVILAFALAMVGCGGTGSPTPPQTTTPQPSTPPPAAPTASISANPTTVVQGSSATLTWQTTNATSVSIDALGTVQPNGSQSVTPAGTTTYTLTAKGAGGTQTAAATVTVTAPPPPSPPTPPPPPLGFNITILPPLPGSAEANATAISSTGDIVGYSLIEDPATGTQSFEATLWESGNVTDIGPGIASGINSEQQVSGYTMDNQAWFWSEATGRIMIGVLPGFGFDSSLAQGIDDDGTVAGIAYLSQSSSEEGFTWRIDRGLQPVQNLLEIFAIKNGVMAGTGLNGQATTVTNTEFVSEETITDLGVLGGNHSVAFAIDGLGHVCGDGDLNNGVTHSFFWQPSQGILDIGAVSAIALNDSDQVVGNMSAPAGQAQARVRSPALSPQTRLLNWAKSRPRTIDAVDRAMIWTAATGVVDLNTLVTSADWTLSVANGINDKGEIVGSAFNSEQLNQAFVLEPK